MAIKVFVDTNIFLDVLLHRGKEYKEAEELLLLAENSTIEIYSSSSCLLNLMYILKTYKIPKSQIIEYMTGILSFSQLVNPDNLVFGLALDANFSDIEDAVQYYTAFQVKGMNFFITSNIKDFKKANAILPVVTAKQFISQYK